MISLLVYQLDVALVFGECFRIIVLIFLHSRYSNQLNLFWSRCFALALRRRIHRKRGRYGMSHVCRY